MAVEYSNDELQKMQQEAVKRVNEMHQRSKSAIDHTPPLVSNSSKSQNPKTNTNQQAFAPQEINFDESSQPNSNNNPKSINPKDSLTSIFSRFLPSRSSGVFDLVKNNSDTIILMAILSVLYTEEADELLLLAVIYIMI